MTSTQREEAGLPKNYEEADDTKHAGYVLREDWMAKIALEALTENQNGLVICGALHCTGLQQRFQSHGLGVEVLDVSKEPWARNPILKSMNEGFR
jgi:hypothetical protein